MPSRFATIGLALALLLFGVQFFSWDFLVDDAFITFRHVANFWAGDGLTYNAGVHVEAYSNPLWTLCLVGLTALGLSIQTAAKVLGFTCGAATLAVFARLAERLDWSVGVVIVATVLLGFFSPWVFWAQAGLEGSLHALLLLAALGAGHRIATGDDSRGAALALGFCLGALAVSRTEAVLLGPAVVGLIGVLRPARFRAALIALLPWVVITAAHLVFRRLYYGAWVATPAVAKTSSDAETLVAGLDYLWRNFAREELWLVTLVAFAGAAKAGKRFVIWMPVALVLGYCTMFVLVGGDPLYKFRPIAMTAPLLFVLVGFGLEELSQRFARPRLTLATSSMALLVTMSTPLVSEDFWEGFSVEFMKDVENRWAEFGKGIAASTPPNAVLAIGQAGKAPFYSERFTIDILGLATPEVAEHDVSGGGGLGGHMRAAPEWVLEQRPHIIYLFPRIDRLTLEEIRDPAVARAALEQGPLFRYGQLFDFDELYADYLPAVFEFSGYSYSVLLRRDIAPSGAETAEWLARE